MVSNPSNRFHFYIVIMLIALLFKGYFALCYATDRRETTLQLQSIVSYQIEIPAISSSDSIIVYQGFVVSYDSKHLIPKWVAYELTSEEVDGTVSRSGSFGMDLNYKGRQAMREDYSYSGWDKGHMAPAADMKWSQEAMWESFYLTNVCPQNHELNGGDWLALEKKAREVAKRYGKVYVICGPIIGENKYGTIGGNKVAVPDKFFKAFLVEKEGKYHSIAFIMENEGTHRKLSTCTLSVNQLEDIVGIDLFTGLSDIIEESVEEEADLKIFLLQ